MIYFYRIVFNDMGLDYATGTSFNEAAQKVIDFYGQDTKIKKIELIGEVANKKGHLLIRLHL